MNFEDSSWLEVGLKWPESYLKVIEVIEAETFERDLAFRREKRHKPS